MILPILPAELRVPLDEKSKLPGCTAVVRPMDLEEKARWADACDQSLAHVASTVKAVRQQLVRIDGLEVQGADGVRQPFDPAQHFGVLPLECVGPIFDALMGLASLSEEQAGNSARPSAPAAPTSTPS